MSIPFLSNITIDDAGHIQFKTAAGANAGKIDQDGNNLVLTNAVGDILLGDGSSDVYIGDGTNNVDIIFEQSGSIKGDGSAVTLTLGGANTTLNLENPNINGTLSLGATTINNKLTFTTANGYILFDYEPPGDTGEYSTETPLLKVQFDTGGGESTILSRISEYRAVVLGVDDTVWLRAGDTGSVIKANVNLVNEVVLMSAEQGFHAYAFPNNDTTWSNRNEFRFYGGSATASDNGLYIGDGGNTQFIDLSRNLKNIGTISSGAITSTGKIQGTELEGTSLDINGNADIAGELQVTTNGTATLILRGDNNNSGDTGQLDSAIKMLHDDGTHGILMETKNYAGKQSFEIKSLSAGTESSRFKIHEDNYILTTGNLVVQDTTTQPLSSIFHGTLVVKGSTSEDPIIAITDSGTANAAAGVFHQSSTSPGFPALVINAASDHSNTPLISARTNVSNTTGVGGTEVFKLEGDGDATFAGTLTVGGADAITIPDYILHAGDDSKFGFPSNDNFKVRLAGSDVFTMSTTSATFAGDLQAGGVYVGATNSSYDLYNNGTSYFNGAVTIDHNLDMTSNGVIKMGGTEVISATRNLNLYSRITFDYGGDHYFEAGTNTLAYKDSTGGSIMTLNASTQAATFSGDITLGANYIGRDGDNYIGFATDNLIKFRVNGATQVKLSDGVFAPQTDSDVDLGSNSTRFANVYADTLYGDGSNLTGITATDNTKLPLAGGSMTGDLNFNSSTKITHSQTGGVFDLNSNSNRVYLQTNHPTIKFQIDNDNTSNDSELFAINISTASPAPLSLTGSGLTLGSGNIILSGTGRIQGIDTVTDSTDAASKNYVDTEISNLLDSAPEDLNTLNELAAALADDAAFSTTVTTALGNRVRVDINNQSLTTAQKSNARTNIGAQVAGTYSTATGVADNADVTPSWVPSSDPGYLTSSSTQSKYLRSDTADTGTGTITLADTGASDNPLILGSSSQTSYTLQQFQTSSHGTNNAYLIAYGAGHGSQAGNFAIKNTLSGKNIFFEVNNAVPLKLENGTSTFTGNIVVSGTVDGRDVAADGAKAVTAHGWGNHASANYLTGITGTMVTTALGFTPMNSTTTTISSGQAQKLGYISVTQAVDLDSIETRSNNGHTAYGWGDHASAGYLTSLPSHTHDDRYFTETEVNDRFARKFTFDPGAGAGNRRYMRLFTVADYDASVVGKLSSAGDYGDSDRATYEIQIATRNNISFDVYQLSTDAVSDDYEFFYKTVGSTYEIWCRFGDYNKSQTFTRFSDYGTVTYNFDSSTQSTPSNLTSVTKSNIYHEGHKPTPAEIGAAASSHTHAASAITSGTFANARISASSVTQHVTGITSGQSQKLGYITVTGGANLDTMQTSISSNTTTAGNALPKSGGTMTGDIYGTSLKIGGASGTNEINFSAGKISFTSASTSLCAMSGTYFRPNADDTFELGGSSRRWKKIYGATLLGELDGTISTGTTAITQSAGDNSTKVATTAFVAAAVEKTQTIMTSNFLDSGSTTSSLRIPFNNLVETSSNQYYNYFDVPADGTIKRVRMQNTSGSMSSSFTTTIYIWKNSSGGSPSYTSSAQTASGGEIEVDPDLSISKGDKVQIGYAKSAGSKYWQGVSASIIIEFEQV